MVLLVILNVLRGHPFLTINIFLEDALDIVLDCIL
jgi:hypothetical protein